jgi:hypothetical protein
MSISWDRVMVEFDEMKEFDQFEVATENANEFLLYPGQFEASKLGFATWKPSGTHNQFTSSFA